MLSKIRLDKKTKYVQNRVNVIRKLVKSKH